MIDRYSQTWLSITEHVESRMADLRSRLEGDLNWEDTIKLRARINECVQLLNIETEEAPLVDEDFELPS